ncbi:MAG: VWA domain-containing protein, partial [Bacteroidaceae bacterium]|nr:VWA domain-containing protein [Bacteroidaceae bacterium]
MQFANPEYLYLLIVLPLLVVLFWLNRRAGHKRLLRLGKAEYVRRLIAEVSETRVWVKFSLLMAALAMIVLMLARPRMGMRLKTDTLSGIEVVVAMDISNSMLANDVEPSRLEKAKQVVGSLCSRLRNDKIALVIFAGNAFLQMPMSADNVSVRMFLDAISTTMIPAQGTSIAEALRISNGSFSAQKDVKRAVVVITDGEDHEGGVEDALSDLRKKGVSVYVLGIGSSKGSSIRMGNDYLRDAEGNVVVTRLNEDMCRQIAKAADGTYIHIDNSNSAQDQLVDELNQLQRSNLSSNAYEEYNDLFPWLAVVTLVLLVLEVVIQSRRSHYFEGW